MAIEHNITHSYMFSSEFEDVVITGASSVSFSVAFEDNTIFSSSFVADANGVVRIFDISTLLSTYMHRFIGVNERLVTKGNSVKKID